MVEAWLEEVVGVKESKPVRNTRKYWIKYKYRQEQTVYWEVIASTGSVHEWTRIPATQSLHS